MSNRSDAGLESKTIVHASLETTSVVDSFQKEHTGTVLLSGKYFLYIFCFFGGGSFLLNMPSCLVLFGSVEFDKTYAKWHNDFQMSEQFILSSKCSQINPFHPLYVEAHHFLFLTTASAVRLHRYKLE